MTDKNKKTERLSQEIKKRRNLYHSLMNALPEVVTITDLEGRIQFSSPRAAKMFRYQSAEGYLNRHLFDFIAPEEHEAARVNIEKMFSGIFVGAVEYTGVRSDGSRFDIEVNGEFIRDSDDQPVNMIFVTRDITERKLAEEKLRKSEVMTQLLLNSAAEGIYGIDLNGHCTYVNKACIQTLGYSSEADLLGKNMHDLIHHSYPDNRPMPVEDCNIFRAFRQGKGTHIDNEVLWRMDGTKFPVEYYSYPQFKDGNVIGAVVTFTDVTERKLQEEQIVKYTEELQEINATKDKFFSIISHDLKSPFSSILGFSQLLINDFNKYSSKEILNYIKIIHSAGKNTFALLENLLEWSRTQTGNLEFNPEIIPMKEMVEEIIALAEGAAASKNIQLIHKIPDDLIVFTDRNIFTTVLRNLVSNAIKFTHKGGTVTISGSQYLNDVEVCVSDTGIGIPEATREKLFRISEKVTRHGTENEKGTGIGLILCKELITMHGGEIWVESHQGQGSDFKFKLPLGRISGR